MNEYITGILDIFEHLREIILSVNDTEVDELLLCGLPDSKESIVNGKR